MYILSKRHSQFMAYIVRNNGSSGGLSQAAARLLILYPESLRGGFRGPQ